MATITVNIRISKARVLDEVAKTTAYIGKKAASAEDPGTYDRVASIDADREQLDRYWTEACSDASMLLDHWMITVASQVLSHHPELDRDYTATLNMPTNWPSQYQSTLQELLMSYLTNSIVAKWLLVTMPSQVEAYASLASGAALQITQLMLMRKRPARRMSSGGESAIWTASDIWEQSTIWQQQ